MIRAIQIQTSQHIEVINVTEQLAEMVHDVADGLALFYIPHTTAALIINEDDQELRDDFVKIAKNWLAACRPFAHIRKNNPNTEAHVFSAFAGNSITLAIEAGDLDLGSYQNILLLEMDGPKRREIRCKVVRS